MNQDKMRQKPRTIVATRPEQEQDEPEQDDEVSSSSYDDATKTAPDRITYHDRK